MFVLCLSLNFMVTVFHPFNFYYICFFLQSGGNSIAMDANATAHLRKQGLVSTDDSPKFLWPKVSYTFSYLTHLYLGPVGDSRIRILKSRFWIIKSLAV